jgi:hypothetical protein
MLAACSDEKVILIKLIFFYRAKEKNVEHMCIFTSEEGLRPLKHLGVQSTTRQQSMSVSNDSITQFKILAISLRITYSLTCGSS